MICSQRSTYIFMEYFILTSASEWGLQSLYTYICFEFWTQDLKIIKPKHTFRQEQPPYWLTQDRENSVLDSFPFLFQFIE